MSALKRRLAALEQREQAPRGIRIFQQDWGDAHGYYEGIDNQHNQPFTQAEIEALSVQGWQCIVVMYEDKPIENG